MPVSVRLDKLTTPCNLGLPLLPTDSDYWLESSTSYPNARFLESEQFAERDFQVIVIENALVEYTFFTEFGGRLVGIRDKRSGSFALQIPERIEFRNGNWEGGFTLGRIEASSFAPGGTEFEIEHSDDSEGAAGAVFYTISPTLQISSQVKISLSADSPWLEIECSTLNRSLHACQIETGIAIGRAERAVVHLGPDWLGISQYEDENWAAIRFQEGGFTEIQRTEAAVKLVRIGSNHILAGAMNDTFRLSIAPLTGIHGLNCVSEEFGIGLLDQKLSIASHFAKPKSQIQLSSVNGESFQASADLYSEQAFHASLEAIGEPAALTIIHGGNQFHHSFETKSVSLVQSGNRSLLGNEEAPPWQGSRSLLLALDLLDKQEDPSSFAESSKLHVGDRAIASTILAIHDCRTSDWSSSLAHIDDALSHEASNGLLWWMRAVVNRQKGDLDEQPDRLNAHYLLPLEPTLRAEAFLCQPALPSLDPIPLIAPVALHPFAAAEIAAMYWSLGLYRDVVRWVDECCRHRESSWLRIIHAAAYLKLKGKEMEAHTQLQFAASIGIGSPYPTTAVELRILDQVQARFPEMEILKQWEDLTRRIR